jgi:hypothetical protein
MSPEATLPGRLPPLDLAVSASLAVVSLAVYGATLTPSLSYLSPDGNELATIPYVLGLAHSPGYPLYTWLGKAFTLLPMGDIAHRVNLMSAASGALAIAGLYLILALLLPTTAPLRRPAAALCALLLAFSPTAWSQAVIAEVYAPNLALMALTLLLLLRWEHTRRDLDFFLFSLTFGLSLGTHISDLGFAPSFVVFVLLTAPAALKRPTWWLAGLAGFGLGVAQFAWLPFRASTLNDRMMLARAPVTLSGVFNYTLGAFPQFKFAFPLAALPDRVVIYLDLLSQEFGVLGILGGVVGLASLLFRRPRHYFLLVGMYLVHVWFFIQYRAFDLEVFFLPAHFLWAIFLAFGLTEALGGISSLMDHLLGGSRARAFSRLVLACGTVSLALIPLTQNWAASDHSNDVALNDFYANIWEMLPPGSALLTPSGVFGYDAFYWQLVYGTRPDVLLPALPSPNPSPADVTAREVYTTTRAVARDNRGGPASLPPGMIAPDSWQVPVLLGSQTTGGVGRSNGLTLYHLAEDPPALTAESIHPAIVVETDLGGVTLVGMDIGSIPVESGGRLHLTLYWHLQTAGGTVVGTALGSVPLEQHEIGFGNLGRYQAEVGPLAGRVIVDDYWVVVPSTIAAGSHDLTVRLAGSSSVVEVASVAVVDNKETFERWLNAAGRSS